MKDKAVKVHFKDESEDAKGRVVGPVWIELKSGKWQNYRNGSAKSGGGFFAAWFTHHQAKLIAQDLHIELCD